MPETSRKKLIGEKTPKDFGIKKTFRKRPYYIAKCDHTVTCGLKTKCTHRKCHVTFGGWVVDLVMGNKAIHLQKAELDDAKAVARGF